MRQNVLIFFLTVLFISSCIGAGTHGSIKGYEYPVSKYRLEEAVDKVLQESL